MRRLGLLPRLRRWALPLLVGILSAWVLAATAPGRSEQNPTPPNSGKVLSSPAAVNNPAAVTTPNGKADAKESILEKTKTDAAELSTLADQLRDELDKMNVNVYSLDVLHKTEQIEKLAKKIKGETHGD